MDHNCVEAPKQAIWMRLMERYDIHVTIVTPSTWPNSYGETPLSAERHRDFSGQFLPTRVLLRNSIPMHVYAADFRRILRDAAPDVIYGYHDYYMFAAYQLFMANLATRRVPIGFYASQNIAKSIPFPVSAAVKHLLGGIDYLFPISAEAEDVARAKGFRGQGVAMPLYVDTELFSPPARPDLRQRLGLGDDAFVVGFAGRFVDCKGLDVLIEAAAKLGDPSVHVALVGKGAYEGELRALAARLGVADRVHLLPPVSQDGLAPFLGGCDVVAMPSLTTPGWKEQFGRLLIEALACGTPVIGSSSGAIPEVVTSTGGGVVTAEGDVGALAAAIDGLRRDPARLAELARTGRRRVLETYTLDAFVDRMGDYFLSILDRREVA
jgi:glycosyltransferase involved in cell wall biosynthesis